MVRRTILCVLPLLICLLLIAPDATTGDDPPATIENPGFEAGTDGWEVHVYGAKSDVATDAKIVKDGKCSLRISATEPSDTALGQEVRLKGGQCYRLSGWVRTQKLYPHEAPVCGTFQVQHAGGRGVIASGINHAGDMEWVRETLYFEAPADGRVRIAVFFVGFGKGTGTAWFDDLKLEEVDPANVPLTITRDLLVPDPISPLQYGQFIEYLCDLVPSMWAEKLHDGSFEGSTPYKVVFLKETDFREHPWYPIGATNRR